MAKLSSEEFNNKYQEIITDNDDLLISLMEDFADSISSEENEELEKLRSDLEAKTNELAELKQKYKERFLSAIDKNEDNDEDKTDDDKVIDIKEI